MLNRSNHDITKILGNIQYRIALAGGWIDQPFITKHNPNPPGSMVVVAIEPQFRWMDRAGICGSTRSIALDLWGGTIPEDDPQKLVRILYEAENKNKINPSGSQDMIGTIYPGINRLDYDHSFEGGFFPNHIESNNDPIVAQWLENHLYILPVNTRADGYNPLGRQNLQPEYIKSLGQSGIDCFDAIVKKDLSALGKSMNDCMKYWYLLLPDIFKHPTIKIDLLKISEYYQKVYAGAMYSGCGGGYLFVASDKPVPGGFQVKIKVSQKWQNK